MKLGIKLVFVYDGSGVTTNKPLCICHFRLKFQNLLLLLAEFPVSPFKSKMTSNLFDSLNVTAMFF